MEQVYILIGINIIVNLFASVGIYVRIVERLTKVETNLEHLMHASGLHIHKAESMRGGGHG